MNPSEKLTAQRIERAFAGNAAFRKLDDRVFIVKQGSTFVMVSVAPMSGDRAQVRCIAQLVKGVNMTNELALELLKMNTRMSFGAFAYADGAKLVLITHSLLGGSTLDAEELTSTIEDMALLADEHDDDIIARFGGQRMSDLLEASKIGQLFRDPNADAFNK